MQRNRIVEDPSSMWTLNLNLLLLILILAFGSISNAQDTGQGTVIGKVFDLQEALMPGIEITIGNKGVRQTVLSDLNGEYEVKLPPGIYDITTKQNKWYPIKHSNFLVEANRTIVIDLYPAQRIKSIALTVAKTGTRDIVDRNAAPTYEEFRPFPDSFLNVVVEYRTRKRLGSITEYRGAKLSYNSRSVKADILRLDRHTLKVEAIGAVTRDDNGTRQRSQKDSFTIEKAATLLK